MRMLRVSVDCAVTSPDNNSELRALSFSNRLVLETGLSCASQKTTIMSINRTRNPRTMHVERSGNRLITAVPNVAKVTYFKSLCSCSDRELITWEAISLKFVLRLLPLPPLSEVAALVLLPLARTLSSAGGVEAEDLASVFISQRSYIRKKTPPN